MHVLDELILVINKEFDIDICDYSRKYPVPWAKVIYATLAHHHTMYEPESIMHRVGLDRSSFYSKVTVKNNLYGVDKEFTRMYDSVNGQVSHIRQASLNQMEADLQEKNELKSITEVQLNKLRHLVRDLDKKVNYRQSARKTKKRQLNKIIDILADIETERLKES